MSKDNIDTYLSQAVLICFCIPEVGAPLAAVAGISQALYDAYGKATPPPASYSPRLALQDLAMAIESDFAAEQLSQDMHLVRKWNNDATVITGDAQHRTRALTSTAVEDSMTNFVTEYDFSDLVGLDTDDLSIDRIESLKLQGKAVTAFLAVCKAQLDWYAAAHKLDLSDKFQWIKIGDDLGGTVRDRASRCISEAVTYATATVEMLEKAYEDLATVSLQTNFASPRDKNRAITAEMRRLRADAHIDHATRDDVAIARNFLDQFTEIEKRFAGNPPTMATLPAIVAPGAPAAAGVPAVARPARPDHVIRFLFESTPSGGPVDPFSDPETDGPVAVHIAGQVNTGKYYVIDAEATPLTAASGLALSHQLAPINLALSQAYDGHFGSGAFAADSATDPLRLDRLTSLGVPVDNESVSESGRIYTVVFSAVPDAASSIDNDVYRQIYTDAFAAVSAWNTTYPAVTNFRLVIGSAVTDSPTAAQAQTAQDLAELVIDAAAGAGALPSLDGLTVLVSSNQASGDTPRRAFTAAATARGNTPFVDGFDVPLR